jgi:tryptophan halogenase
VEQAQEMLSTIGVSDICVTQLNEPRYGNDCWVNNCIDLAQAPSLSDLFVSPHEGLRNSAVRLLDLLASFDDFSAEAVEFNRLADAEYQQLREFVELNLFLLRDSVAAVADYFRSYNLSADAQHRYDLFKAYGRHPTSSRKIFSDTEWAMVWLGNKVFPKASNPGSQTLERERIINHLSNLKEFIYRAVDKMPLHNDYLARASH